MQHKIKYRTKKDRINAAEYYYTWLENLRKKLSELPLGKDGDELRLIYRQGINQCTIAINQLVDIDGGKA